MKRYMVVPAILILATGLTSIDAISDPQMAPDGSWVGGDSQMAPNGSWVGGEPEMAPDGSWIGTDE